MGKSGRRPVVTAGKKWYNMVNRRETEHPMKELLFIYNPHAGQSKVRGKVSDILNAFVHQGFLPTAYPTQAAGDATELVRSVGKDYQRIVCCGGDGTLHEVVAALMEMENPPVLGYIPAGTTNDFSKNLDLPRDMTKAAQVAAGDNVLVCDMGRFNAMSFVYVAAFGAFTEVSYDTPQPFKNLFGHLAYVLEGIGHLGSIRSYRMTVEHDQGTLEGEFIFGMVGNTRSVGGFKGWPADQVKLDDGKFEVILVRPPKNPMELQTILMSVITQNPGAEGPLIGFHTAHLKVICDEDVAWTLDGEFGGDHRAVEIENICQALRLCRGEGKS